MIDTRLPQQLEAINRAFAQRESELLERLNVALADLGARDVQIQRMSAQCEAVALEAATDPGHATNQEAWADLQQRLAQAERAASDVALDHEQQLQQMLREHSAQLLDIQQRASNDRSQLTLLHARQIAALQQDAMRTRQALEQTFQDLMADGRRDAELQRKVITDGLQARISDRDCELDALRKAVAQAHALQRDAEARAAEASTRVSVLEERLSATLQALAAVVAHAEAADAHRQSLLDTVINRVSSALAVRPSPVTSASAAPAIPTPIVQSVDTMNPLKTAPAASVEELLGHFDERFVVCAYLTLLKRPVDDDGLAIYTRHLRAGMSRAEVVASLLQSEEGQRAQVTVPGLADWMAANLSGPPGLAQRLVRRLVGAALQPVQRQLNAIQNQLGRSLQEGADRQVRLEIQLADALRRSDQVQRTLSDALSRLAAPAPLTSATPAPTSHVSPAVALDGAAIERARRLLAGGREGR